MDTDAPKTNPVSPDLESRPSIPTPRPNPNEDAAAHIRVAYDEVVAVIGAIGNDGSRFVTGGALLEASATLTLASKRLYRAEELMARAARTRPVPPFVVQGPHPVVPETRESLDRMAADLKAAKGEAENYKREAQMYANAWRRELGPYFRSKAHAIDALVVSTRELVERLTALDAEKKKAEDERVAAVLASFDYPVLGATYARGNGWRRVVTGLSENRVEWEERNDGGEMINRGASTAEAWISFLATDGVAFAGQRKARPRSESPRG